MIKEFIKKKWKSLLFISIVVGIITCVSHGLGGGDCFGSVYLDSLAVFCSGFFFGLIIDIFDFYYVVKLCGGMKKYKEDELLK